LFEVIREFLDATLAAAAGAHIDEKKRTEWFKNIVALDIQPMGTGKIRDSSRFMAVIEVVLKDLLWFGEGSAQSEESKKKQAKAATKDPLQAKALESATRKLNLLVREWKTTAKSDAAQHTLNLVLALQAFLKNVPQLEVNENWKNMVDPNQPGLPR